MPGAGFCVAAHVLPSCQVGALDIGDSPAGEERRGGERGGEGRLWRELSLTQAHAHMYRHTQLYWQSQRFFSSSWLAIVRPAPRAHSFLKGWSGDLLDWDFLSPEPISTRVSIDASLLYVDTLQHFYPGGILYPSLSKCHNLHPFLIYTPLPKHLRPHLSGRA